MLFLKHHIELFIQMPLVTFSDANCGDYYSLKSLSQKRKAHFLSKISFQKTVTVTQEVAPLTSEHDHPTQRPTLLSSGLTSFTGIRILNCCLFTYIAGLTHSERKYLIKAAALSLSRGPLQNYRKVPVTNICMLVVNYYSQQEY